MKNDLQQRAQLYPGGDVRETRSIPFRDVELREKPNGTGGTDLAFEGYACVTEVGFTMWDMFGEFEEFVRQGSFKKTLAEGCDTCFLVNHEGVTLARTKSDTLKLAEDDTGLHSEAGLDPVSPAVQVIRSAMERKDIDEMSFAFRVTRQEWSPDYMQRDILEVDLNKGDVSVVNYGANPFTSGGLRSFAELRRSPEWTDVSKFLRAARTEPGRIGRVLSAIGFPAGMSAERYLAALAEIRAGKTLSSDTMATLQAVLDLVAGADDNVDEALVELSDLMGVPNPDDDEKNESTYSLELARAVLARAEYDGRDKRAARGVRDVA